MEEIAHMKTKNLQGRKTEISIFVGTTSITKTKDIHPQRHY